MNAVVLLLGCNASHAHAECPHALQRLYRLLRCDDRRGRTSLRRISMGVPCSSDIVVAMGSAVYGTPHITSNFTPCTLRHITSATCTMQASHSQRVFQS
jgi:hypothetical protein